MLPVGHFEKPQKRAQPFSHFLAKCSFPGHHDCNRANTVIIVLKYWKTSLDTGDKQISRKLTKFRLKLCSSKMI